MNPVLIEALVVALEQGIPALIKVIQTSGLSPDETQAYIARIVAAQNKVPDPQVG